MASVQLALRDVTIGFGDGPLLKKVNLEVRQGESIVLIGPSGLGKTVVLKLFAGLLKPDGGQIIIEGRDLHALKFREQVQLLLKMGMLFQKNALFDSLTVGDNIAFPLREKTLLTEGEIQDKVGYFLEAVGLAHARTLFPDEISGGMQKRLGIARALALSPQIVLYDDPTAGLDPITSRKIADLILFLRQEHKSTTISVTNDMARAYQLADRIVMVVDGELIVTGNKRETLAHKDPRVSQFIHGDLTGPLTESLT
ncbi:MAG: ATP-binding cassette domain-containing protein [Bdellovibrionales bacterium]|nr:ATP-binding cassette domain-containing protein [Bdellovibrionales bacterium]